MPRPRLRFSLLTVLLVTTIVGMAIVLVMQWRQLGPLREENRRLRAETGQLTIDDPKKAYAVTIPSFDDNVWRWRVHLPPGRTYWLHEASGVLSPKTDDRSWSRADVLAGPEAGVGRGALTDEVIVEAQVRKQDDGWKLIIKFHPTQHKGGFVTQIVSSSIRQPNGDWLSHGRARVIGSVGVPEQTEFGPDESILLLHMIRAVVEELPGGGIKTSIPTGPADGFALWLEPPVVDGGGNGGN